MSEERAQISMSNTKKEMLEAYQALLAEVQTKSLENPREEQKRIEQKKVVAQAEALSAEEMDKFAREIMGGFESSVALLQSQLREGFDKLRTLDETIKIKEAWIEDLYAIQSNADSLSTLILAQKKQKEEALRELEEIRTKQEREIEETREAWQREQEQYKDSVKQEKATAALLRKREEDEYEYTTSQRRRKEEDAFREQLDADKRELEERRQDFERTAAERERALAEAEGELEGLRRLSESLDTRMQEVESRAIKATEERLEREHRFAFDLAQKETEGQLRLKDQQIELLQQKIGEIEAQLREAGLKVSTSEETVRDIALRAIDSSALTGRALSREPRPTAGREGTEEA